MGTLLFAQDPDSGETEIVEFDAVLTLSPDDTVAITDHPVETGANVTDHARDEPELLSIEAKVSTIASPRDADVTLSTLDLVVNVRTTPGTKLITLDVPTPPITPSIGGLVEAGVNAITTAISGPPKATVIDESRSRTVNGTARAWKQRSPRNRVRDIYERLLGWKTKHLLVTIQTTMREYFDMMIARVAAPQTVDDGSAVTFQLDFKRIRVADSETVLSPQPAEARGALGKNRGNQNGKDDKNAEEKERLRSLLKQLGTSQALGIGN